MQSLLETESFKAQSTITELFVRKSNKLQTSLLPILEDLPLGPFFIIFSIAYLILAMHLQVTIRSHLIHDDALYWGHAFQIVKGNWLGEYSQMTLAKGPGFPFFLATNAILGIPITLMIALLYLFACGLLLNTLRELGLNKYFVLTLFIVILFHPALFPTIIIRDNIYPALSLIIISGLIRLVLAPMPKDRNIFSVVAYGGVFAFFWMTREEGIWIVPGILILLLLKTFVLKKHNLPVKDVLYRFAFFSLIATMLVSTVALINYYNYGKFEVVDFKGDAYSQALKSLNSVDVGPDLSYLPVSFNKRQQIYKVSPTFLLLKDYFEDKGKWWTSFGCEIYSWTCGDYAGGWFAWALRDAVSSKGYYDNPLHAAEFYKKVTKEIQNACFSGVIKCRENLIPLMPNVTFAQLKELPKKIVQAAKVAMVQSPIPATDGPSTGSLDDLQRTRFFLGNPNTTLALGEQKVGLSGWFYSNNINWIVLSCSINGSKIKRQIDRMSSPDIAVGFKNPKANFQRFSIEVPENEDCSISTDYFPSKDFPIKRLLEKPGFTKVNADETLYILEDLNKNNDSFYGLPLKIKNSLTNLYRLVIPVLVLLGAITYLIYLFLALTRRLEITDIFIVSTMLWSLFFSRILLLVLVDISSFPAINILYMSAAFPILCIAALFSVQLVFTNKKIQSIA